jgi:hypothetical protein
MSMEGLHQLMSDGPQQGSEVLTCGGANQTSTPYVVTPLWAKCEGEAHTPKSGNLESPGTPENSELKFKGQNTSH